MRWREVGIERAGIENLPVHPTLNKSFKYVASSCAMELTSGW